MKKFLLCWVLFGIFQLPFLAYAQTTYTPNLNLALPPAAPGTWGEQYNNNFSTLDTVTGHPAHVLQEEGVSLPARANLNFLGTSVTVTDNPGADSTDVTLSPTGSGHAIKDEGGTTLTQRPIMNFTGGGVTCTDNSGQNATVCDIPAGSVNVASPFAWTGANSWLSNSWSLFDTATPSKILKWDISGFTASTTRTMVLPNASTRLLGDSDFSAVGIMARTAANTYAGRTLAGTTNRITITNGDGVAGAPTFNLGSLAFQTDQSNTVSTGDQDFGAATSFKIPVATGATPTVSGRIAYDSTANRYKFGANGSTITIPALAEIQPIHANLTALSGLAGSNNALPIFTGVGTMTLGVVPTCVDTSGQHLNFDGSTHVWSCGTTSTGGLTGATTGKYLIATSATNFDTSGNLSEAAGVVNAASGFTIGNVATNYLSLDTSAVTGAKTWTVQNTAGLMVPCDTVIGNYTDGHVIKVVKVGSIITCADGGAAGVGTWTDSSSNTGTNKILRDVLAGGTGNSLWTPVRASWDAGSLTPDGTNCADPTKQTINSGPIIYSFSCADSNSSTFDGHITLPITMAGNLATVKFRLTVNDVDSSSQVFAGGFKAQCRASGTAPSSTWGTAQTLAITMVTANNDYSATTAAVTPDGTCSAGSELFWRWTTDATTNTDDGDARVISVAMEQAS